MKGKVTMDELLSQFWTTKFTESTELLNADMDDVMNSIGIELEGTVREYKITDYYIENGVYEVSFSLVK